MGAGPAMRSIALQADADDHVGRRLEGHGDVMVSHRTVRTPYLPVWRGRRRTSAIVDMAGGAGLRVGSRSAAEFRVLEPEEGPAVVEHLVAQREQLGLFRIERGGGVLVSRLAGVVVAETATGQRLRRHA